MEQSYFIPQTENSFLQLQKPIVFFDLETTGTNTSSDRIVELCAIRLNPDGSREERHHLINPGMPIPPEATAVHGISNDMVAGQPTFGNLASPLSAFFEGCDLGGYNVRRFDVPLLMAEFHRHDLHPIHPEEVKIVDSMTIYHRREKRDLSAAVRFYLQREHEGAHSALADVEATIEVLKRQLLQYEDLEPNTDFLHDYTGGGETVDFAGKFARDGRGCIVFNFGKHKGREAAMEPDYLQWMLQGDFPFDTKLVAQRIWDHCTWEQEIRKWLIANKVLPNKALAAALYTTIKFGENIFPFAAAAQEGKATVTYLVEPPVSYVFPREDTVRILLRLLEEFLGEDTPTR